MNARFQKSWLADALPNLRALFTGLALPGGLVYADQEAQLADAYDASLHVLARFLELRDAEIQGHSERVTRLTVQFARYLKLPETEVQHLRRGALLHDLGKLGIPDEILLKKGHLTEDEWKVMRKHPVYVYEMLYPVTFLREALEVAYCHHERWDGTGYPRGLKGEEIPYGARLFAIVDVWDALLSARSYKDAWSIDKAQSYMLDQADRQFDSRLVVAFFEMLNHKRLL